MMKRGKAPWVVLLISLVFFGSFYSDVYAAVPTAPVKPTATPTKPVDNILIPKSDGQITNVTTVPGDVWRTGTTVRVQWAWPGYVNFLADVMLGKGSGAAFQSEKTIISGWTNSSVAWEVPDAFPPGIYTVRVQSSKNNKNFADATVRIENSTVSLVSPRAGQTVITGTNNEIVWSFQGKPGPLKLELIPASGGNVQLIASGIPWGESGAGKYAWTVPGILASGNYQLRLTGTANSAVTNTGPAFAVVTPSVSLVSPTAGSTVQQTAAIPIKWSFLGDIGPSVKLKVWQSGGSAGVGAAAPPFEITTPTGSAGQGGFDGWKPVSSSTSQQYLIRVESVQNPKIFSQLTTPFSVAGSPSVHGATAAPNPSATLTAADVTFYTSSDNKNSSSCVSIELNVIPQKKVASRSKSFCGSSNSTEFKNNSANTVPLENIDNSALRSEFSKIFMKVTIADGGDDNWKFTAKVNLRFSDGSMITKQTVGEQSVTSKAGNILNMLVDEGPSAKPGIITIYDWQ